MKKSKPVIMKEIDKNKRCVLYIQTHTHRSKNHFPDPLLPEYDTCSESEITPLLLFAVSQAYQTGYLEALNDINDVTEKMYPSGALMLSSKISKVVNFKD